MPGLSHEGTPGNSNESDAIEERRQDVPSDSEYKLQREANIAENRKLLSSLGLLEGGSSAIDLDKSPKGVNGKKGEKGKRYAFCLFCLAYRPMI